MYRKQAALVGCLAALPLSFLAAAPADAAAEASARVPAAVAPALCGPGSLPSFDAGDFPEKPRVRNRWLPLKPGRQAEFTGTVTDLSSGHPVVHRRRVVSIVTGLTKVVDGVKAVVLWDRDYQDGVLKESELAFFAQSDDRSVWLLGEYPEEFEGGAFKGAPSTFIAGLKGARPGYAMPGSPHPGQRPYVQASSPGIAFLDCGKVVGRHTAARVLGRQFADTLKIDEYNPLEGASAGHQQKFYAPGVGNYKVTASSGDSREVLDLARTLYLDRETLAKVDSQALLQDARGYRNSKDIYARTPHAQRCGRGG